MYIKVTNYIDSVNRLKLEKLGFSTKRDDESTIGQFGSGIKFAPIAALRKGIDFAFAGNDDKGSYILRYAKRKEDDIDCVYYQYEDYEKPSSFTVDAGSLSWQDPFQIYREVIANAIDESKIGGNEWNIELVDDIEVKSVKGEFSVYMSATDELMEIHNNFDKYFSINRYPVYEDEYGKIYESIDENIRVYYKGVLVFCYATEHIFGEDLAGLFDYELSNLQLNEERKVSNVFEMNYGIAKTLLSINDVDITNYIVKKMAEYRGNTLYELSSISSYIYENVNIYEGNTYLNSFNDIYQNHVVLPEENDSINIRTTINARGYQALRVGNEQVLAIFKRSKIPNVFDILGETIIYEKDFNIHKYKNLSLALLIVNDIYPESTTLNNIIATFKSSTPDILGLTIGQKGKDDSVILIEENHASLGSVESLIATIIHEWDHYETGCDDGNQSGRLFRNLADARIGKLVFDLWVANKRS